MTSILLILAVHFPLFFLHAHKATKIIISFTQHSL